MNIIFLDVDGVLNSHCRFYGKNLDEFHKSQQEIGYPKNQVEPRCVDLLNQLISATDSKIVMSSTWRHDNTVQQTQELCDLWGIKGEVIGNTPHLGEGCVRGNEIYKWLQDNKQNFDITNYIILDDDSDMLLWQAKHFFHCDNFCGLTPNVVYKAIRFLKGVL